MADPKEKTQTPPAAETKPATVTVRCLLPFEDPNTKQVKLPGQTCEVTLDQAAQLTKELTGTFAFRGERYATDGDVKRHSHRRAVIVDQTQASA